MADDLDFRPDALDVDDEIRYLGQWYRITRRRMATASIVLDLELLEDQAVTRTVFYRPGTWVAARPKARS